MKRIFYMMAATLLFAFATNLSAQMPAANEQQQYMPYGNFDRIPLNLDTKFEKITRPQTQALDYTVIDRISRVDYVHMSEITPLAYDPYSGVLFMASGNFLYDDDGQLTHVPVYVKKSSDMGATWDSTALFTETGFGGIWPSIAVTNYNQTSNPDEVPFGVFQSFFMKSGTEWNMFGAMLIYLEDGSYVPATYEAPTENNPSNGQQWTAMKMKSYVSPENQEGYTFNAGMLSPVNTSYQYGTYGFFAFDMAQKDVATSTIPQQFMAANFIPSSDPQRTYQSPMEIDVDANGKLYAAVANIFGETTSSPRLISVATSEDLGQNWSDWNQMPAALIDNYKTANTNYSDAYMTGVFQMQAFAVTGDNEWSYVFPLALSNNPQEGADEIHLMEASYKDGAWSLVKIADLGGLPNIYSIDSDKSDYANYRLVLRYRTNPLGNEIQLAKTKDGSNLIVKWIDPNMEIQLDQNYPISFQDNDGNIQETTVNATLATDIFTAYRPMNGGAWSTPKNQTQDSSFHKVTWIPNIVPDVNNIPLITHASGIINDDFNVPLALNHQIVDITSFILYSTISSEANSVVEEPAYSSTLYDIYPNPAQGIVEIPFNLGEAANVRIEIHNALGQLVNVALDSYQNAGIHAVNLNTASMNSGTYYVSLVVNGERITKMLNVIK
ncbi:MAG: T9SS type A sorting domain-containing protein [Bacteroidota bacterium]